MKAVRPEYYFSTVNPGAHIAGVDKPSPVQTIDVVVGVGAHVSDEFVYEFVKRSTAARKRHGCRPSELNAFQEKSSGKAQPNLPHHPGAIKFYKETGIWN